MTLDYFYPKNTNPLITEFYHLNFDKEDIPFQSTILPICYTTITSTFNNNHHFKIKRRETAINDIILSGQFYESYQFSVNEKGHSYGISLHPTALYKLTSIDASKIKNKHVPLLNFSEDLYHQLNPLFIKYEFDINQLTESINKVISEIPTLDNPIISKIDKVINLIEQKEGLINTYELLDYIDFSQKTLETHFKKIIGFTPGKYIRLYRFLKLMRRYESKSIELNDLIYLYNYYDRSHFFKDFKHFMKQSPREYFKSDHALLRKYLRK